MRLFFLMWAGLIAISPKVQAAEQQFPKSPVLLEQRVLELKDELKKKQADIADLAKLSGNIKTAQQCLAAIKPINEKDADGLANGLRESWNAIANANAKAVIGSGTSLISNLESRLDALESGTATHHNCLDALPSNSVFNRLFRNEGAIAPITDQLLSQYLPRQDAKLGSRSTLRVFIEAYESKTVRRAEIPNSVIASIARDVDARIAKLAGYAEEKSALEGSLKQLADATEREVETAKKRIEEIDKLMSELDNKLSSGTASTDHQLIIAVYLMIGALIILFLSVKFLGESLALRIVETRSLVEVVSMAFLLLTIIILGTGNKMPVDAIGTLLGSIAGYIFGRKMSDKP